MIDYNIGCIERSIKLLKSQVSLIKDANAFIMIETINMIEKELKDLKEELNK